MSPVTTNYSNASGTAANVNADGTINNANSTVSESEFLTLLITQLKNQDPTNPTDETQMLSQLAQFSSLQDMQDLNKTMTSYTGTSQISQSAALIGKTITAPSPADGTTLTGIVSAVSVNAGTTYLQVGTQQVDESTVTSIQ